MLSEELYVGDKVVCVYGGEWVSLTPTGEEVDLDPSLAPKYGDRLTIRRIEYDPTPGMGRLVLWFNEFPGDTLDNSFVVDCFERL